MTPATTNFLAGGGEMGALIGEYDWTNNPLGRSENWPQSSENRCAHYADLAPAAFMGTAVVRSGDITKDPRYGHSAPHHGMPEEVGGRMSAISNFQFSQVGG